MKDNLFDMLMTLFEKTLTQLKHNTTSQTLDSLSDDVMSLRGVRVELLKTAENQSVRVFTPEERLKLTKTSYQFLMRLATWGIVARDVLELIINQFSFSESSYVTLDETKWTIRKVMAPSLSSKQLAFLDLLLYQKEDGLPLH